MTTKEMIAALEAQGFRVTKRRGRAIVTAPPLGLNAVGKPYGANYDPNYRMRIPRTTVARLYKPMPADTRWA
jgi:hypothetical protein